MNKLNQMKRVSGSVIAPCCAGLLSLCAIGCGQGSPGGLHSGQENPGKMTAPLVDQRITFSGNEPQIAVDPTNPQRMAISRFSSVALSNNGGATFPTVVNAVVPAGFNLGFGGDAVPVYDSQGRLFLSFLATDNTTGGVDVFIQPINHATGTVIGTAVNVSAQAGLAAATGSNNDKEWLAVDRFVGSPFRDRLYMIWTDFGGPNVTVNVSFSSNNGVTWSPAQTLNTPADGFCWPPHIAAAPNGDVYAAYHATANSNIFVFRSPFDSPTNSGGNFDLTTKFAAFPTNAANLTFNVQGSPPTLFKNQSWTQGSQAPYILPDPTNANRVVIIASDDPTDANNGAAFDDAAVMSVATNNRGATWSAPTQVDAGPGTSHQLFPTGSFALNSQCLSVAYYDSRAGALNPAGNFLLDVYTRTSADSGATWGPEVRINDQPFDPDLNAGDRFPPSGTLRIGEYIGIAQARGLVWTGNDPSAPPGTGGQQIIFDYADGIPPTFTSVPADITTTTCGSPSLGTATAVDDTCGIGGVTVTNNAPASFPPGTTVVTWTARDRAGNFVTATQRVTITLTDNPACCPAGTNVIVGTPSNNTLNGTPGADCILGLGGQDILNGNGGNDFISGGDGDDTIDGGGGNDVIFGGTGQDKLNGGADGNDSLFGGDGDDNLQGGIGNDLLSGGLGQDTLLGQDGDDQLFGDSGDDNIQGGNGNDTLVGGLNNDTCNGGTGTNTFAQCEFGAPNSCTNGTKDGTETDVDCGGSCARCGSGKACVLGSDCQAGICQTGICQSAPTSGAVGTAFTVTADWGSGYCVVLQVNNSSTSLATSYTINLNTNASTIYTSWNGTFSGNSGAVNVHPAFAWNATLDPGETDGSIGFCANRTVSGSGVLPTIVSTTATF